MSRGVSNFLWLHHLGPFLHSVHRPRQSQYNPTVDHADIPVGWRPPALCPSGAYLARGTRILNHFTRSRMTPHRGCASTDAQQHFLTSRRNQTCSGCRGSRGPAGRWPTCRPPVLGRWRPPPASHVCRVHCVAGTVDTGVPVSANGCPGGLSGGFAGEEAEGCPRWPESDTPKRLRPGHGGHTGGRLS
jgi:hypothetical protein